MESQIEMSHSILMSNIQIDTQIFLLGFSFMQYSVIAPYKLAGRLCLILSGPKVIIDLRSH